MCVFSCVLIRWKIYWMISEEDKLNFCSIVNFTPVQLRRNHNSLLCSHMHSTRIENFLLLVLQSRTFELRALYSEKSRLSSETGLIFLESTLCRVRFARNTPRGDIDLSNSFLSLKFSRDHIVLFDRLVLYRFSPLQETLPRFSLPF